MIRLLAPTLLLLFGGLAIADWNADAERARQTAAELGRALERPSAVPASSWAAAPTGGVPAVRPVGLDLFPLLRRWGLEGANLPGEELLDAGVAGTAAWVVLDSWLAVPPGSGGRARSLRLSRPEADGPVRLSAELGGPPVAVITWTRALLAQPAGAGILADPRRVVLRREGRGLVAELEVDAWPAARLLEADS
jgi:hypothetical protein